MIAFHLIISAYGFWLPNDPRGSWSDFVGSWELLKFGPATKVDDSRNYAKDPHDVSLRRAAKQSLKYPPVRFTDPQRIAIADGFAHACADGNYCCGACCIGFDHAHLVLAHHPRPITVIAGHLKSGATRALTEQNLHPLNGFIGKRGGLPTPWSEGCWKVFIDTNDKLDAAIRYVQRHPHKECLPEQRWDFVNSFSRFNRRRYTLDCAARARDRPRANTCRTTLHRRQIPMQRITRWILATIVAAVLLAPQLSFAGGAKKYQVTGTVIELTDEMVVVQKPDGEKWELNRDPKLVVKGELKLGAKVTIQYTMSAMNVEVKAGDAKTEK